MDVSRIEVKEKLLTWDRCKFPGDLDDIIKILQEFKEQHKQFHRIEIEEEMDYGYYGESWTSFVVTGIRWETDDEMSKRIEKLKMARKSAIEKKAKEAIKKEAKEKQMYERLKEKFDK